MRDEINMLRVEVTAILRAEVTAFTQSDEDLPPDGRISVLRMAHRRGCSRDAIERMCKTGLLDAIKVLAIGGAIRDRREDSAACGSNSARILWFHRAMNQADHYAALLALDIPRTPLSDADLVKEFRATEARLLDLRMQISARIKARGEDTTGIFSASKFVPRATAERWVDEAERKCLAEQAPAATAEQIVRAGKIRRGELPALHLVSQDEPVQATAEAILAAGRKARGDKLPEQLKSIDAENAELRMRVEALEARLNPPPPPNKSWIEEGTRSIARARYVTSLCRPTPNCAIS